MNRTDITQVSASADSRQRDIGRVSLWHHQAVLMVDGTPLMEIEMIAAKG